MDGKAGSSGCNTVYWTTGRLRKWMPLPIPTGLQDLWTTGRQEQRIPLQHPQGRRIFQGLLARQSSGRTMQEYTAARGRHDHATFRELADASVRCTGLVVKLLLVLAIIAGNLRRWSKRLACYSKVLGSNHTSPRRTLCALFPRSLKPFFTCQRTARPWQGTILNYRRSLFGWKSKYRLLGLNAFE